MAKRKTGNSSTSPTGGGLVSRKIYSPKGQAQYEARNSLKDKLQFQTNWVETHRAAVREKKERDRVAGTSGTRGGAKNAQSSGTRSDAAKKGWITRRRGGGKTRTE